MAAAIPQCPRCGYDQSGAKATGDAPDSPACPLTGVCSECGLEFYWGDLLNPRLSGPPWSFEHRGHAWVRPFVTTLRLCLRPRRLWSQLRLEHPVRLGRAAFVALVGLLLMDAAMVALNWGVWTLAAWKYPPSRRMVRGVFTSSPFLDSIESFGGLKTSLWPYRMSWGEAPWVFADPWVAVAILAIVIMPLGFMALPHTLRRASVRKRHLVRAWLYSLPLVPLVLYSWVASSAIHDGLWATTRSMAKVTPMSLVNSMSIRCVLLPVVVLFLWRWWTAAVGLYMRIDEARRVALAMLAIAVLAAAALVLAMPHWNHSVLLGWSI